MQFRHRREEMNHSGHLTDSEQASRLPNSLMPNAKPRSANLPVFTSLVWRGRGSNPVLPHPEWTLTLLYSISCHLNSLHYSWIKRIPKMWKCKSQESIYYRVGPTPLKLFGRATPVRWLLSVVTLKKTLAPEFSHAPTMEISRLENGNSEAKNRNSALILCPEKQILHPNTALNRSLSILRSDNVDLHSKTGIVF